MKTALENMADIVETLMKDQEASTARMKGLNRRLNNLSTLFRMTVLVMREDDAELQAEHLKLIGDRLEADDKLGDIFDRIMATQESREERTEHVLAVLRDSLKECEDE